MSRVDIDALNALRSAATPGKWIEMPVYKGVHSEVHASEANRTIAMWAEPANAKLISALVGAWPDIETEIRQLRKVALAAMRYRDTYRSGGPASEEVRSAMMLDLEISALVRTADPRETR